MRRPCLDHSIFVHRTFVREHDPLGVAYYIANPSFYRSALIVVAPDHPQVLESLRKVRAAGAPIVQIVTRPATEITYVGIDNYAAGRTAAFYMSRMMSARRGSFVAICHSGAYENHKQRIKGFSEYLEEHRNENHCFTEIMFSFDDELLSARHLRDALGRDPEIIGIYTAGGGNSPIAVVLQELASDRNVFWVGHELT